MSWTLYNFRRSRIANQMARNLTQVQGESDRTAWDRARHSSLALQLHLFPSVRCRSQPCGGANLQNSLDRPDPWVPFNEFSSPGRFSIVLHGIYRRTAIERCQREGGRSRGKGSCRPRFFGSGAGQVHGMAGSGLAPEDCPADAVRGRSRIREESGSRGGGPYR